MSVGQRIAQKRKELGLSQEALGEQLGVSRQSISKWESDTAMPEIEKLITMSRLFSVSVGWLLGVEDAYGEAAAAGQRSEELTDKQLKMVEEIVDRYLAAQPKPMSKRRRRLFKVAIAFAAVCLVIGMYSLSSKLDTLDNRYNNLQNSVNNVSSSVNNQIGNIANRVEEVLKAQNDLTADYDVARLGWDLRENTVSFSAYAVPKTYTEGMTAVFLAESGGELLEFPGTLREDKGFEAEMSVPLTDVINISVVFFTGNIRETQLLDSFTGLYHQSIPEGYAEDTWQFDEARWEDGELYIPAGTAFARDDWNHDDYYYFDEDGERNPADVSKVEVGIFKNQELVCWLKEVPQPATYHGFDDCLFFAYEEQTIPFAEGDVLQLATVITDEYGRITVRGGSEWMLEITGETPVEAGKVPSMALEDTHNVGYYQYDDPTVWGL